MIKKKTVGLVLFFVIFLASVSFVFGTAAFNDWINPSNNDTIVNGLLNITVNISNGNVTYVNFNGTNYTMSNNSDNWYYAWDTTLNLDGSYNITVYYNNSIRNTLYNITVDNIAPVIYNQSFNGSPMFDVLTFNDNNSIDKTCAGVNCPINGTPMRFGGSGVGPSYSDFYWYKELFNEVQVDSIILNMSFGFFVENINNGGGWLPAFFYWVNESWNENGFAPLSKRDNMGNITVGPSGGSYGIDLTNGTRLWFNETLPYYGMVQTCVKGDCSDNKIGFITSSEGVIQPYYNVTWVDYGVSDGDNVGRNDVLMDFRVNVTNATAVTLNGTLMINNGTDWYLISDAFGLGCVNEGLCILPIVATDGSGSTATVNFTLIIDNTNPDISDLMSNDTDNITNDAIVLNFTAWANDTNFRQVKIGNVPFRQIAVPVGGNWYSNISNISDLGCHGEGICTIEAVAIDMANNRNYTYYNITVDLTDPEVYDLYFNNTHLRGNQIFNASANDTNGISSVRFNLSNSSFSMLFEGENIVGDYWINRSFNTSDFGDGVYNVSIYATDLAGNRNDSYYETITIDNTYPMIWNESNVTGNSTAYLNASIYDLNLQVSWIEINWSNGTIVNDSVDRDGNISYYMIDISTLVLFNNNTINWRYHALDSAGNYNNSPWFDFVVNLSFECADGIDNDLDTWIDMADPGCSSSLDDNESNNGTTQCNDGIDNDGDLMSDGNDPGCSSALDDNESDGTSACQDLADNDLDTWIDLADPGCVNATDNNESNNGSAFQCNDGIDNDLDNLTDGNDPGCANATDNNESDGTSACQDLIDNDLDGWIDMMDPGCINATDNNESNNGSTECSDGMDNDGDLVIDGNDLGCVSPADDNESDDVANNLVISEVYYDAYDESDSEFVELYNPLNVSINISGWTINDSSSIEVTIPNGSIIPAFGYFLIADTNWSLGRDNLTWPLADHEEAISLTNNDYGIALMNGSTVVDAIGWGSPGANPYEGTPEPDVAEGNSIERRPGWPFENWQDTNNNSFDWFGQNIANPQNSTPMPECNDGLDNDLDGWVDFPADPGCINISDNSESNNATGFECSDLVDNDNDTFIDGFDPGCFNWSDNNETDPIPECQDGQDNDLDGLVDLADPGCANATDNDEGDGTSQCQDLVDNDGDLLSDMNDPGCSSPTDNNESDITTQCQDGLDNDGDNLIDLLDPGCMNITDNNESDGTSQCQDGLDNDGDNLIDMADPGCVIPTDNNESNGTTQCQDGLDNDGDNLTDMNDTGCVSPIDNSELDGVGIGGNAMVGWSDMSELRAQSIEWDGANWINQQDVNPMPWRNYPFQVDLEPSNDQMVMMIGAIRFNNAPKNYHAGIYQNGAWSNLIPLGGSVHYYYYTGKTHALESYGVNNNVMAVYSDGTPAPKYRIWNGAAWSPESSARTVAGANLPYWMEMKRDPTSDDMVLVVRDARTGQSNVYAQVWDGVGFGNEIMLETNSKGSVDVEYDINGRAIVVWVDYATRRIQYRIWDGTSWGAEFNTLDIASGDAAFPYSGPQMLDLDCDTNSVECVLVSKSHNGNVRAQVWDGTLWLGASPILLGNGMGVRYDYFKTIAVEYDQQGRAMVAWADDAQSVTRYRIWNGAAWTLQGSAWNTPGATPTWIELAANPGSNEMILTEVIPNPYPRHGGGSVYSQVWDGNAFDFNTYTLLEDDYAHIWVGSAEPEYMGGGNATPPITQCNDGFDNDGDNLVDMADPGCSSLLDNNEADGTSQCQDLADNDGDTLIDMLDPGCSSPQDNNEADITSQCQDTLDNDGDGLTDMNDPGCSAPIDNDESDGTSQCQDGIDNDNDTLVDMNDPGCSSLQDDNETDALPPPPPNNPPVFNPNLVNQSILEDQLFVYDINCTDADNDSITYYDNVSQFNINPITGLISWTPTNDDVGDLDVNITCNDSNSSVSQGFIITVNNTNDAPTWNPVPSDQTINEDSSLNYTVFANDVDVGDVVGYFVNDSEFNMNIITGLLTWTPAADWNGIRSVLVTASDGIVNITQAIDIVVNAINDCPNWTNPIPDMWILEDGYNDSINLYNYFNDTDNNTLLFSFDINDTNVSIVETNGIMNVSAVGNWSGISLLFVNASDGICNASDNGNMIIFTPVNDDPLLDLIENITVNESDLVVITPNATDVDSTNLTYSFSAPLNSSGMWQTGYNDNGTYYVTVTVDDNDGGSDDQQVVITVLDLSNNSAPVFNPNLINQSILEDQLFVYDINCTDADNDSITYSDNVSQFNIDSNTGLINWTPGNNDVGDLDVNIICSDGIENVSQNFIIDIQNVNDCPNWTNAIPDMWILEDGYNDSINLFDHFDDVDNDSLIVYIEINETNVDVDIDVNGTLNVSATSNWNGISLMFVTMGDGICNVSDDGNMIIFTPVNDDPVLDLIENITVNESDLVVITPNATDVDSTNLTYSFSAPLNSSGMWQTNYSDNDTYYVTVTVDDNDGGSDNQQVVITVLDIVAPQCNDGLDNDGDNLTDFPNDPGCDNLTDNDETDVITCSIDLDCGVGIYINTSCYGLDFITTIGTDTCFNPGTVNSYCGINESNITTQCNNICSDSSGCDYTQCSDGNDNDGDGLIDLADMGCVDYYDDNESDGTSQCQDLVDNDGDGLIDMADPGCSDGNDNDESDGTSQCQDLVDNDGDGYIDYPADFGCTSAQDNDETNNETSECGDGIDNDGDGLIDMADPGCSDGNDNDESDGTSQCQDGVDNDFDGLTDMNDPGCSSSTDDNESDGTSACQDGMDNDLDGLVDLADPGCDNLTDDDEADCVENWKCTDWSECDGEQTRSCNDLNDCGTYLQMPILKQSCSIPQPRIHVDRIRWNEYVVAGDVLELTVDLGNNGDFDLNSVSVQVIIPELGLREKEGPFKIDKGDSVFRRIIMYIPSDTPAGEYYVRISISDDKVRRIKHRVITVI